MKKYTGFMFALFLLLTQCKTVNDKNPMLIGSWEGVEWLVEGQPSGQDATQVGFEFLENGAYSARFGADQQSGVWRTDGNKLYTTEQGKKEIMVKILQLDAQVLQFEMNRGGQQETLKLAKVQ